MSRLAPFIVAAMLACGPATAAVIQSSPATIAADISKAGPSDGLALAAGDYGVVTVANRQWSTPITIDARAARFAGLVLKNVDGLILIGGAFSGGAPSGYAVQVQLSHNVQLLRLQISGVPRAVVFDRSTDLVASGLVLRDFTIDGIDVGQSQRVRVDHVLCSTFSTGVLHPDCVQLWSRPGGITTDVAVTDNTSVGDAQGFDAFNHIRAGIDDGGFDRVNMDRNYYRGTYPSGVSLYGCRNCTAIGNDVATLPGTLVKPGGPVAHAVVNVQDSIAVVCGNAVADVPSSVANRACVQ